MIEVTETSTVHNVPASDPDFRVESQALEPVVLPRDFHFGRPSLARYTPKILCVNRFAVAAHWVCPLNRQRAVREGLAEQTAVVLGRFFDTSPTLRPVVAHGLVTPSAVNRPVRSAPRSAGASPRTAAASDGSPPAGASRRVFHQPPPEIPEVVGQHAELQPDLIRPEPVTRQARPMCRLLAFLDPLLRRASLVVKPHDGTIREREIRHEEADAGEQLADVVLDFCHDPSGRRPAVRLILEALVADERRAAVPSR